MTRLLLACLWISLLACAAPPGARASGSDPCALEAVHTTFLQVWNRDRERRPADWYRLFSALAELGIDEVILQWTRYGHTSFYHGHGDLLGPVLEAAQRYNMHVMVGLQYDPRFWRAIDKEPKALARYLAERTRSVSAQVDELARFIRARRLGAMVSGWYIADELDDETWLEPQKAHALTTYLQTVVQAVRHSGLDRPVAVSGFSNGRTAPARSATLWHGLLRESGVDLFLFQDGIGAGKLTLAALPAYLAALDAEFPGMDRQFRVVTELFRQQKGEAGRFEARPAPYNRILRQLDLATRHGTRRPVAFSVPDYLLGERPDRRALREQWQAALTRCRLALIQ